MGAGQVLHEEIQTAEFVSNWHNHSTELWTRQDKRDAEIVNDITDFKQPAILMRVQLEMLMEQIKCDWTSYFIIPLKFNNSK